MARDEKLDLLHRIPLFSGVDRHGLERLGMLSDEIDVPADKVLMRQGEIGSDMMVIVSGTVAIDRDGERVNTLGAGDFFGEIALVDGGPRTATVTAAGAVPAAGDHPSGLPRHDGGVPGCPEPGAERPGPTRPAARARRSLTDLSPLIGADTLASLWHTALRS